MALNIFFPLSMLIGYVISSYLCYKKFYFSSFRCSHNRTEKTLQTEGVEKHMEWLVATLLHSTIPERQEDYPSFIYLQRSGLPSRKKSGGVIEQT